MVENSKQISTSALAKKLGKTSRQMFAELEALGWIRRVDEQWQLTAKGTFEQGAFRSSEKYGTYIVWPESVACHQALVSPDDRLIAARGLAKAAGLTASCVNRLLADLGWTKPYQKGWQATQQGRLAGAEQREDPRSGVPYVLWDKAVLENSVFQRTVAQLTTPAAGETLGGCAALDGHLLRTDAQASIDNWLYLAGITHACRRQLPADTPLYSDFYLPGAHLYIEFWGVDGESGYLAEKMRKQEIYRQLGLNVLELQDADLDKLDTVLPRALLKYGIET